MKSKWAVWMTGAAVLGLSVGAVLAGTTQGNLIETWSEGTLNGWAGFTGQAEVSVTGQQAALTFPLQLAPSPATDAVEARAGASSTDHIARQLIEHFRDPSREPAQPPVFALPMRLGKS